MSGPRFFRRAIHQAPLNSDQCTRSVGEMQAYCFIPAKLSPHRDAFSIKTEICCQMRYDTHSLYPLRVRDRARVYRKLINLLDTVLQNRYDRGMRKGIRLREAAMTDKTKAKLLAPLRGRSAFANASARLAAVRSSKHVFLRNEPTVFCEHLRCNMRYQR